MSEIMLPVDLVLAAFLRVVTALALLTTLSALSATFKGTALFNLFTSFVGFLDDFFTCSIRDMKHLSYLQRCLTATGTKTFICPN